MNCDPIAGLYRWLEYASFGRALERRREAFLPLLIGARRVLMLGDGDGRFLAAFVQQQPLAQIDCVDNSPRMLARARARAARCLGAAALERQVRFYQADALHWLPPVGVQYDLIVTHFFLDCFTDDELARIVPRLAAAAGPEAARWLVSEFCQPESGWAAWRARVWIRFLYGAFGLATGLKTRRLPKYRQHLLAGGFHVERKGFAQWGLLTSELWQRGTANRVA